MDVAVLGGTGVISRCIVEELVAKGHRVTVVNRGTRKVSLPEGVSTIVADKSDEEAFGRTMEGHRFGAVIDMIAFNESDARHTVEVFGDKADQLLFCSSIAAYKRPPKSMPIQELTEELSDDPVFPYSFHKAKMERYLATQHGSPAITIFRPSLTFGEGARNVGILRHNYNIVERIRLGKPLVMFGDGTTPFSFSFAPDVAVGIVGLVGNSAAFGEAYHICSEERTLWQDLYLKMGEILGKSVDLVYIPAKTLYETLPDICNHLYFEKRYPGLFDNTKIRSVVPGFKPKHTLRSGLELLLESWERDGLKADPEKDALEDRLVEATILYQNGLKK
jgi:nucleoside-diphosphate-sugar epimerase